MPKPDPQKPSQFFDYAALPADRAERLKKLAEIFEREPRTAGDAMEAGRTLLEAKELAGHGKFLLWIETESDWDRNLCRRVLQSAKQFFDFQIVLIEQFDVSALYLLANPKLPPAARQTAIAEAARGERITFARAQEIAGAYCKRLGPRHLAESPEESSPDRSDEIRKSLFALVMERYDSFQCLVIHDENGQTLYCGSGIEKKTGRHVQANRESADLVLLHFADAEPKKRCQRCKRQGREEMKPLSMFSANKSRKDGRAESCKLCERERIAEITRKKKAAKEQKKRDAQKQASEESRKRGRTDGK